MEQQSLVTTPTAFLLQRKRRRLYTTLLLLWIGGVVWIMLCRADILPDWWEGCLVHQLLGIPCPACGTTRSVAALLHGHLGEAIHYNPLGLFITPVLLILPFWLITDAARHSSSLFETYERAESWLSRPLTATIAILLMLCNWVWNLTKY